MKFRDLHAYKKNYFTFAGEVFYTAWYDGCNGRVKTAIEVVSGDARPFTGHERVKIVSLKTLKTHVMRYAAQQVGMDKRIEVRRRRCGTCGADLNNSCII